ncbi:DUF4175 family protein [Flavobacteriaceae bacterium S356]|uniref:DUF4175 family protein n=1 Tax=Asprobacillus argus TaxID=3076534 RepID=A0ABU3LCV0_9FLAO|nr:DUF4175 family protein [Flavobacteriaceae bacterium S356]
MMQENRTIEQKLYQFYRKYYVNKLIKGTIFFLVLGVLFAFSTLYIEYFLWLKPSGRTMLFLIFIAVQGFLLFRFILFSAFKLIGLQRGISFKEASKIIGDHFPEVQDKLLNVLQLKENTNQTDLLLASIAQKSKELQPVPFAKAINFSKNKKYIPYFIIPVLVWMVSLFSGTNKALSESFTRVVNFNTEYVPPAPFAFQLLNENLDVIQGKQIEIVVKTNGSVVPLEAKIFFNDQEYFLDTNEGGTFSFTFTDLQESTSFYVESNGIESRTYKLNVIKAPIIQNISLDFEYPRYIRKENESLQNITNVTVPEGTRLTWNVTTNETEELFFINKTKKDRFKEVERQHFEFKRQIKKGFYYQIASSNAHLKEYEKLGFTVNVLKDEYPKIEVKSSLDSISEKQRFFAGKISDDYGLKKLQVVYYDQSNPEAKQFQEISIQKSSLETFFYELPDSLLTKEGIYYELYFEVFDNDGVNGAKKAVSRKFSFKNKTDNEKQQELLEEQKDYINKLENSIQNQKLQQKELDNIQKNLKDKKEINWNDKKKIDNYIKRQEQYKQMMERQTDKMQENLDEKKEINESLQNKKEELKKRIEELKKLEKQQKLLDELEKMAQKLNKEQLINKAKELAQQNKQQEKSLERILELTKRFYVEQKTMQIADKLDKLAKKQESVQNDKQDAKEQQDKINKEFKNIEKELEELSKDNEKLKEPMKMPEMDDQKEDVNKETQKAKENLDKQQKSKAKKNQKKASKKMKEMSQMMQQSMMDMQGEMIEENIDDLRKILENLVTFSFEQEALMNTFDEISSDHPEFGKNLKKQNEIKTYFEHIDDSLYMLSMRMPTLSTKIQDDLSSAHYNLNQSLENFAERRFNSGISNQRYVMTAANGLADFLSNMLNNMQNSMSPSMGQGKKSGKSFSLPDLIQKQKGLGEKMKDGQKKGNEKGKNQGGKKKGDKPDKNGKDGKKGSGGEGEEQMNQELYQIYKEQSQLREQLQNAIKQGGDKSGEARKALKTMEQLENEILEKGFNQATLQKMRNLEYQLLKLDKAAFEQGFEKKRKSTANTNEAAKRKIKELTLKKLFYNQTEILNRQSLPLQQNYKKKVQKYFSAPKKKD